MSLWILLHHQTLIIMAQLLLMMMMPLFQKQFWQTGLCSPGTLILDWGLSFRSSPCASWRRGASQICGKTAAQIITMWVTAASIGAGRVSRDAFVFGARVILWTAISALPWSSKSRSPESITQHWFEAARHCRIITNQERWKDHIDELCGSRPDRLIWCFLTSQRHAV